MKVLFRVSDGFISNTNVNDKKLTAHENKLIADAVIGVANIPANPNVEDPRDYKIANGRWELLPENKRPSFAYPSNNGVN